MHIICVYRRSIVNFHVNVKQYEIHTFSSSNSHLSTRANLDSMFPGNYLRGVNEKRKLTVTSTIICLNRILLIHDVFPIQVFFIDSKKFNFARRVRTKGSQTFRPRDLIGSDWSDAIRL